MTTDALTTPFLDKVERHEFYRRVLEELFLADIPYLVGGAFALRHYTGVVRDTKDLDLFVHPDDVSRTLELFSSLNFQTEMTMDHWIGKIFHPGGAFVDVIFSSANGLCRVDEEWFRNAVDASLFGFPCRLVPPPEMVWSKGYVLERERYDGADINHLFLKQAGNMDWERLLRRFADHWEVLLSHLILFQFSYPSERHLIPASLMRTLLSRKSAALEDKESGVRLCRGVLLSGAQYKIDIEEWSYEDARLPPWGPLKPEMRIPPVKTRERSP